MNVHSVRLRLATLMVGLLALVGLALPLGA